MPIKLSHANQKPKKLGTCRCSCDFALSVRYNVKKHRWGLESVIRSGLALKQDIETLTTVAGTGRDHGRET